MSTLTVLFINMSIMYNIPAGLLTSLCYVESKHKITAVHKDDGGEDSLGVCQIKLSTAKELGFRGTVKQLMQPNYNVKYSAKFLRKQIDRYNGNVRKAVISYNRGNSRGLTTSKYQVKVYKQWGHK